MVLVVMLSVGEMCMCEEVLPRAKNTSGRDEPSYELLKLTEIISF